MKKIVMLGMLIVTITRHSDFYLHSPHDTSGRNSEIIIADLLFLVMQPD